MLHVHSRGALETRHLEAVFFIGILSCRLYLIKQRKDPEADTRGAAASHELLYTVHMPYTAYLCRKLRQQARHNFNPHLYKFSHTHIRPQAVMSHT